jgi:hypothetical protein
VDILNTPPSNATTDDSHKGLDLVKMVSMKGVPQTVKGSTLIDDLLRTIMQKLKYYGTADVRSGVALLQHG